MLLSIINPILGVSVIIAFIISFILILEGISKKSFLSPLVSRYILWIGFVISFGAILASLFYSNGIGFEPCLLCWMQRIFMYPQAVLFGIALWKKDRGVLRYALALTIIGTLIALYHNYIDLGGTEFISCGTNAVSCTKRYVLEFGFITIPLMSLSMYLLLLTSMWTARRVK